MDGSEPTPKFYDYAQAFGRANVDDCKDLCKNFEEDLAGLLVGLDYKSATTECNCLLDDKNNGLTGDEFAACPGNYPDGYELCFASGGGSGQVAKAIDSSPDPSGYVCHKFTPSSNNDVSADACLKCTDLR